MSGNPDIQLSEAMRGATVRFDNVQAVLFDLDGTLIDSAPDLGAAADRMRVERGLASLPLTDYRPLAGSGARGMLSIAFGLTPESPDFATLREEFFVNYERCMLDGSCVFDGVSALLGALVTRGMPWGIVTNKMRRFTDPLAAAIPLFATAGAVVSGDSTPHAKPHPEPLFEACRRMGVAPDACVYVGDDQRDIAAGRAAGMRTVAATYGYLGADADCTRWGADAAIDSPLALLKLLQHA